MKVLVTGANGFVGRATCSMFEHNSHRVIRAVRASTLPEEISVGDIDASTDWRMALSLGVDAVVHLAGQTPPSGRNTGVPFQHYHQTNTLATANLAEQCAEFGVKRFIFVSTVKVLGEGKDKPYRSVDLAMPTEAYAKSKWEAEQMLKKIASETGMEVVVIRPPLVYGPGVKGNFLRLLEVLDQGRPLPFGAIQNQRSLIYLGNLVDAIRLCLTHPNAAGKTFLVSDGEDISTPDLIRYLAAALGRKPCLLSIPVSWMRGAAALFGQRAAADRLLGSLAIDLTEFRDELHWTPPYSLQAGISATVAWYRHDRGSN